MIRHFAARGSCGPRVGLATVITPLHGKVPCLELGDLFARLMEQSCSNEYHALKLITTECTPPLINGQMNLHDMFTLYLRISPDFDGHMAPKMKHHGKWVRARKVRMSHDDLFPEQSTTLPVVPSVLGSSTAQLRSSTGQSLCRT